MLDLVTTQGLMEKVYTPSGFDCPKVTNSPGDVEYPTSIVTNEAFLILQSKSLAPVQLKSKSTSEGVVVIIVGNVSAISKNVLKSLPW